MAINATRFILLLLLALLAGTMFGIWIGFDPATLSPAAYIEQQQNAIRSLSTFMPAMGGACIVLAAVLLVLSKGNRPPQLFLAAAIACLLTAALVTRFGNQPINAIVMTWTPASPPANWAQLRDTWWRLHIIRMAAGIGALSLAILATTVSERAMDRARRDTMG